MEHLCHRCRAAVEDGVPFCPHCGAPQIKVSGPAAPELPVEAVPPDTAVDVPPPVEPLALEPAKPRVIDWSRGMRAAALAGLVLAIAVFLVQVLVGTIGVALRLPPTALGLFFMLASSFFVGLAGALAVLFYSRRRPPRSASGGMGARLGLVTGILGFLFYSIPYVIGLVFFHAGSSIRDNMVKAIEQVAAQNPDPSAQELAHNLASPAGLAAFITGVVVLLLVAFLLFSTVGGAVGAAIWGGKKTYWQ